MSARRLWLGMVVAVGVVGSTLSWGVGSAMAEPGFTGPVQVNVTAGDAATVSAVILTRGLSTEYYVAYSASGGPELRTPEESLSGASSEEGIEVHLSGLMPRTTYHFVIVASDAEGISTQTNETGTFETSAGFSDVAPHSAVLGGAVEPEGLATTYSFEYGTTTSYGQSIPAPEASAGASSGPVDVQARVEGLEPATVYHFRVVARNANGTKLGADETFTTLPESTLGLPDGRRYEMVSPAENSDSNVAEPFANGLNIDFGLNAAELLPIQAAADGDAMVYAGGPSASGGNSEVASNEYLATRAPAGGWSAANITPEANFIGEESYYQAFSSDLSVGFISWQGREPLTAGAPSGFPVLYARGSGGSYAALFNTTPSNHAPSELKTFEVHRKENDEIVYAGASADLGHALFEANDALTQSAEAVVPSSTENDLYDSVDGQPYLVNVLPGGTPAPNAIFGAPPFESSQYESPDFSHVISGDGSRIFWSSLEGPEEHRRPKALYVRENDTQPESLLGDKGECTVPADACTVLIAEGGRFWTASEDGSKALYTKEGGLYEFDAGPGQSTDLTPGGGVEGVVGASEDLSYVYFVANLGLYVLHEGEQARLVAQLASGDKNLLGFYASVGDWSPALGDRTAEVSPDGRHLVFMSSGEPTGYENNGASEVFVYDAEEGGRLFCVSCNQSGAPPEPNLFKEKVWSFLQPSYSNTYLSRWMSTDGNRVFFDSFEPLVPQATNGELNVYEWEHYGSGSCVEVAGEGASERAEKHEQGCVYLLSGGTSRYPSFFADASTSGNDVFMITRAQLTPEDQYENINVFDAHVGTGPTVAPQCTSTGCQGVPGAPPVFATPSSVTFNGVGNFPAPAPTVVVKTKPKPKKHKKQQKKRKRKHATKAKRHRRGA
jgi:hypothetical protein